ncbi:MAG: hypothetical protein HDT23_08270 [Ruminococcus sp.]|nr:hypothetical protein [Ruminococcus sp.]
MSGKTISLLLTGIIFLTSCGKITYDKEPQNKSFFAMDTYMSITAYGKNAETALNQAEEKSIRTGKPMVCNKEKQ